MNAHARKLPSRNPRLSALCLAIGIALALPMAAHAQEAPPPPPQPQQAASADAGDVAEEAATDPFSLEDSDDPERLKELTQVYNRVEAGLLYVDDDSYRFGRYTGLTDQGVYPVLGFDLYGRGPYNSESAQYWRLTGRNLGFDSREAAVEFGTQGTYRVKAGYSEIPIFRSDSTRTFFLGAGGTDLTLPANWVAGQNTATMTQLLPDLQRIDLKTERRRTNLGVSGILAPNWEYSIEYLHETKDGNKGIGAVFGNSGGNPRAVILPEPVDYLTQQFEATLRYTNRRFQLQGAYYLSLFSDRNDALAWSNPYAAINGWDPVAGFPTGRGQMSLPPDNRFHQVTFDAGYNLSEGTRISASVARGRMTQDDAFLPYTDIPALAATITEPLPRSSLKGRIDTTVATLRIASRPTTEFSWNASYRYDNRDNKTPRDAFVYIGGDSQAQDAGVTSSRRRFNEPYSFKEEQVKADAAYRMFGNTSVSAGVERSRIDRTFSERERADEDTYRIGLDSEVSERFAGHFSYTRSRRDGSTYFGNHPLHEGFSPEYVASLAVDFENLPGLRKYFLADRTRDRFSLMASFTPSEAWELSAAIDTAHDDYTRSELGLVDARTDSATLEAVYAPSPAWSAYGSFTAEKLTSDQRGHSFSGGANLLLQAFDPNRDWSVDHRDRIDTLGLGFKRSFPDRHVDLGADYLHSRTRSNLDFSVGPALAAAPLPRDTSKLDSLNLYGSYKVRENMAVRLGLWYERFQSRDWAVDGIAPNTLANVILLGENSPDYAIRAVTLSLVFRF